MEEVSKERFKEVYFRLGGGDAAGWGQRAWDQSFEDPDKPPMKFKLEPPPSPKHTRMMIVSDYMAQEHRLFFMTEEGEESFFDQPGEAP